MVIDLPFSVNNGIQLDDLDLADIDHSVSKH